MIEETPKNTPHLVRALKLRDLILFNLVAVLGLRHLGTTAKFGPGSLLMSFAPMPRSGMKPQFRPKTEPGKEEG